MRYLIILFAVFLYAENPFLLLKEINSYEPVFVNKIPAKKVKKVKPKPVKVEKEIINFKLKAIINKKAYINDKILKVGDFIYGYRVKEILPGVVILEKDGHIKKLTFQTRFLKVSK